MAKATLLQMINKVLENLGESQLAATTSLSGMSLMIFNTLNELMYNIGFNDHMQPLETNVTMTLTTAVQTYSKPSDVFCYDKDSFIYDSSNEIVYYTPQRFDREYKEATSQGEPDKLYEFGGYLTVYPIPNATANGKTIKYRAWKYPVIYNTATATGTSYIPEGFDVTMLADYVTFKIMHYKENPQAQIYYTKVFGDGKGNEGSLEQFKRIFRSPDLTDGSIFVEPMENSSYRGTPRSNQGY